MKPKRRWMKRLLIALVAAVIVAAGLYMLVGSSWFFKRAVLPRAAAALGMPVSVETADISPFSEVRLTGLHVGPAADPLLTGEEIRCRYDLFAILGGSLDIEEAVVRGVVIRAVQAPDGSWNFPQAPADGKGEPSPDTKDVGGKELPTLNIRSTRVEDVTVIVKQSGRESVPPARYEISNFQFAMSNLCTGEQAVAEWSADLRASRGTFLELTGGRLDGSAKFVLEKPLVPSSFSFETTVHNLAGMAGDIPLRDRRLVVKGEGKSDEAGILKISEIVLAESTGDDTELQARLSGEITPDPFGADLELAVDPVTPALFNLAGTVAGGYHFGQTSAALHATVAAGGERGIATDGTLRLMNVTVRPPDAQPTDLPPTDVDVMFDVGLEEDPKALNVQQLNVEIRQQEQRIVELSLDRELVMDLGTAEERQSTAMEPAHATLTIDRFPLQTADPFIPAGADAQLTAGILNATIKLVVGDRGGSIAFDGNIVGENVGFKTAKTSVSNLTIRETFQGRFDDFEMLVVEDQTLDLLLAGKRALATRAQADFNVKRRTGTVHYTIVDANDALFGLLPPDTMSATRVRAFSMTGNVSAEVSEEGSKIAGESKLRFHNVLVGNTPEGSPLRIAGEVNGSVNYREGQALEIKPVTVAVQEMGKNDPLIDLQVSGTVAVPPASGTSTVSLTSTGMRLGRLAEAFAAAGGEEEDAEAPREEEKSDASPAGLEGLNLTVDVDLRDILYKELAVETCTGELTLQDSVARVPLSLVVNGAPLDIDATVDLAGAEPEFDIATSTEGMPLNPAVASFAPDFGGTFTGGINTFSVKAKGSGSEPSTIVRNLDATLNAELGDFTLPAIKGDAPGPVGRILSLVLLPLRMIGNLGQFVPTVAIPEELRNASAQINQLFSQAEEMAFSGATLNLAMKEGKLDVNDLTLEGDVVQKLHGEGVLDFTRQAEGKPLNPALDLTMRATVRQIPLTVPVGGTLEAPKVNPATIVSQLGKDLGTNLLKGAAKQLKDAGKVDPKGLLKGLIGTDTGDEGGQEEEAEGDTSTKGLLRGLLGGSEDTGTDTEEKPRGQEEGADKQEGEDTPPPAEEKDTDNGGETVDGLLRGVLGGNVDDDDENEDANP